MSDENKILNMNIVVDDGSRRVPILNTDGEEIGAFRFHPTDIGIIERYNAMAERFGEITAPLEELPEAAEGEEVDVTGAACPEVSDSGQAVFAKVENHPGNSEGLDGVTREAYGNALKESERRLCTAVDELLGSEGAAVAFFGSMHPFSPVNGEFYCTQVLNVLGQFIGAQFEKETTQFSEKAKKYAKKAEKRIRN